MAGSVFALADCNNFYASCETAFNPTFAGRPLVVLSNNDGCVIARSPTAKQLGITMGAPIHTLQQLIHRHAVVVCSANFPLYGDMSQRVMQVLGRYTPCLDVYSIDEGFLDFAHVPLEERAAIAGEIRTTVGKWVGIPVTLGVASTKTLAKAAADRAKKLSSGVLVLRDEAEVDALLREMAVEDVWGIGARRGAFLRRHGLATAYAFKYADTAWVKRHLYVPVARTQMELRGVSCLPLEAAPQPKKEICSSRAFGREVRDIADLKEAVALYASRAAEKARAQGSAATVLTVFIMTNPFQEQQPQYSKSCTLTLPRATAYTPELVTAAHRALERMYKPGYVYHKAGVMLSGLVSNTLLQGQLFDLPDARHHEIMEIIDSINTRYGRDTIRLAATGKQQRQVWRSKQQQRSPRFTTQWSELARAH